MKKIINMLNAEPSQGQVNNQPSQTIPDQSMTIKELLIRYAKGLPLEGEKTPIWEGEEGYDIDPNKLDLAEIEELAEKAREELKEINTRVEEDIKKAKSRSKKVITDVEEITDENNTNI